MQLKFKYKLLSSFLVIIIITLIIGIIGIKSLNVTNRSLRKITQNAYPEIILLEKIKVTWQSILNSKYLLTNDNIEYSTRQDITVEYINTLNSIKLLWQNYYQKEETDEIIFIWNNFNQKFIEWELINARFLELNSKYTPNISEKITKNISFEMIHLYMQALPLSRELSLKINEVIEIKEKQITNYKNEANRIQNNMKLIMFISILLGILLSLIFGILFANKISHNINIIIDKMQKVTSGDYTQKSNIKTNDELEDLSNYFNIMTNSLYETKNKYIKVNDELQSTIEKLATANNELSNKNIQLKEAQAKIIHSGKMAAIGTLAGGVAHEINNPLSAVISYSMLLKEKIDLIKVLDDKELFKKYISAIER